MERHGFVARLKPEFREQYIEAHNNISPELVSRYRRAGVHRILLFLFDEALFMYMEVENWKAAQAALGQDPLDIEWQKLVSPMKDPDFREMHEIFRME
ncbi:MAG TPA: L-rhamnose mutarotase [Acidobacteriota bacterium]|jgi:L-rhamnose mutarotase|nr:L-rhamnose mutarotase [Acidobacteriota bacterium]